MLCEADESLISLPFDLLQDLLNPLLRFALGRSGGSGSNPIKFSALEWIKRSVIAAVARINSILL
jgi:hypothetical protein